MRCHHKAAAITSTLPDMTGLTLFRASTHRRNLESPALSPGSVHYFRRTIQQMLATILVLAAGLLMSGCATNPVTGKQDLVLMSEQKEIQLGSQAHQKIMQQYRPYNDPELQSYVEEIVRDLSSNSHRDKLKFHVTVLDSPQVNAFALPGGYIYITRGIMAFMNSEAELAGVLAHEIGHVTARHGVRQHSLGAVTDLLGTGISILTGSRVATQAAEVGGLVWVRGYGRKLELEADRLGAEYLARSGYDPEEMINVVGLLKSQEVFETRLAQKEGRKPNIYHGIFSTHPANDKRLQEVVLAANKYKTATARNTERETFLQHLEGLVLGHGEKDGVLRGRMFYHNELDLYVEFPEGWKVENLPDRLVAMPVDRLVQIQITTANLSSRETAENYLKRNWNRLHMGKAIRTAGFDGYTGRTSFHVRGIARPGRIAAVTQDRRVYEIRFLGKDQDAFERHDSAALETIQSMRRLQGDEARLAKPKRIHITRAQAGDTFASLAKRSALEDQPVERLRLLNGMYPEGEPKPGQWIKTVQ